MRAWSLTLLVACGGGGSVAITADSEGADAAMDAPLTDSSVVVDAGQDSGPSREDVGPDVGIDATPALLGPPYPVVLAHGFFGFDDFAGAGFADYFYGVREALLANGERYVFTPAIDPFNDSTRRGEQLLGAVERISNETHHAKVNIIAHSQGGLDARYVAHVRPDLVASVTTIAAPHRGAPVADAALTLVGDERMGALLDALVRAVGAPLFDASGAETSVIAALRQLSTEGTARFNEVTPDAVGVRYFSIAGRSDLTRASDECASDDEPSFLAAHASTRDTIDPLLSLLEEVTDGSLLFPAPNDGLVRVDDAKWGTFLGCVPADHFDEIGHLLGDAPGVLNDWSHRDFYVELVEYLRDAGL